MNFWEVKCERMDRCLGKFERCLVALEFERDTCFAGCASFACAFRCAKQHVSYTCVPRADHNWNNCHLSQLTNLRCLNRKVVSLAVPASASLTSFKNGTVQFRESSWIWNTLLTKIRGYFRNEYEAIKEKKHLISFFFFIKQEQFSSTRRLLFLSLPNFCERHKKQIYVIRQFQN